MIALPDAPLPLRCAASRLVRWLLLSGLVGSLGSCDTLPPENQGLKKRLADAIRRGTTYPLGDTVLLDMTRVTDFAWDTLYTFTQSIGSDQLGQDIGVSWPVSTPFVVDDDEKLFVFMYKGQVAEYVEFYRNDDPHNPSSMRFIAYFALGEYFTPATATFKLVKRQGAYGYVDSVYTVDLIRPNRIPRYRHTNPLAQ